MRFNRIHGAFVALETTGEIVSFIGVEERVALAIAEREGEKGWIAGNESSCMTVPVKEGMWNCLKTNGRLSVSRPMVEVD